MLKLILILLVSLPAFSSYDGLDAQFLKTQKIAETSRACCNFVSHPVLDSLGLFQFLDAEKLGTHSYHQKEKDPMGLVYTCKGGFVDVAHLRDNADWTAHILFNLPKWIGSGKTIDARNEGGFKSRRVYFPKMEPKKISELSSDDLAKISVAMGFGFATLHEIVTGFSIAVSFPVTLVMYERASSFSVEDQYSNLLGAHLGAEAAQAKGPYEDEMTKILSRTIKKLSPLSLDETKAVHESLHHRWWKKDLLGRNRMVAKRNYGFKGEIFGDTVAGLSQCQNMEPLPVEVPDKLSNGMSVSDYFLIQGEVNRKFTRQMIKSKKMVKPIITQKDYPGFISTIKEMNDTELHSP
ncbi:MAG: DUF4056 domain-containing protein [Bdellovibrionota bacterium]